MGLEDHLEERGERVGTRTIMIIDCAVCHNPGFSHCNACGGTRGVILIQRAVEAARVWSLARNIELRAPVT